MNDNLKATIKVKLEIVESLLDTLDIQRDMLYNALNEGLCSDMMLSERLYGLNIGISTIREFKENYEKLLNETEENER